MSDHPVKALLVDDNPEYVQTFCLELNSLSPGDFEVSRAGSLSDALDRLSKESFDIILLDLTLPDNQDFATFSEIRGAAPHLPVIVLTTLDDTSMSLRLVQEGAQDYLIKGRLETSQLIQAMLFALERHRITEHLRQLSLLDELTGLLNRRGFFSLGKQQIKLAQRAQRQLLLFYIDMDRLKHINDEFGHHEGDRALQQIAEILTETFRSTDLIARLGGDEFCVLAIDAIQESSDNILARLGNQLHTSNLKNPVYQLSLSLGVARFDPKSTPSLENMLIEADNALYEYRQDKNSA